MKWMQCLHGLTLPQCPAGSKSRTVSATQHESLGSGWGQGGRGDRRVSVQSSAVDLQVGREEVAKGDTAGAKADETSGARPQTASLTYRHFSLKDLAVNRLGKLHTWKVTVGGQSLRSSSLPVT